MFVIIANCVTMAIEPRVVVTKEVRTYSIYDYLEVIFQLIYTFECILKIVALGFVYEKNSYLRDMWNVVDFAIVSASWVTIFYGDSSISAFRAVRALRTLRTLTSFPEMAKLVQMLIGILPSMGNICLLCMVTVLVFAIVSMQLFSGCLGHRCVQIDSIQLLAPAWESEIRLNKTDLTGIQMTSTTYNSESEYICQISKEIDMVYNTSTKIVKDVSDLCPGKDYVCMWRGNPVNDDVNFDHLPNAALIIFSMFTMDGWSDVMYMIRDVMGSKNYDAFFLSVVYVGGFFIINLVSAIQFQYYDTLKQQKEKEALRNKKMLLYGYGGKTKKYQMNPIEICLHAIGEKEQCLLPQSVRDYFKDLVENETFEFTIQMVIILNSLSLGSEFYNQPCWWTRVLDIANIVFTVIFTLECVLKIVGLRFFCYINNNFNLFDLVVVVAGLVEVVNGGGGGGLSVLRSFRIMRILKIVKGAKGLQRLVRQIFAAISESYNLGLLIMLFVMINALIGRQLFSQKILDGDGDPSRFHFETFGTALRTVFICMTGYWVEPMQDTVRSHGKLAVIFFCEVTLIGFFILLNLFLAILLQNIDQVQQEEEQELKRISNDSKVEISPECISELSGVANYLTSKSDALSIESVNFPDNFETNISGCNKKYSMLLAQKSSFKQQVGRPKDSLEAVIVQPILPAKGRRDQLEKVVVKMLPLKERKSKDRVPSYHSSESESDPPRDSDTYYDRSVTSRSFNDEEPPQLLSERSEETKLLLMEQEETKQELPKTYPLKGLNKIQSQRLTKIPENLNESESELESYVSDKCCNNICNPEEWKEKMKLIKHACHYHKEQECKSIRTSPYQMIMEKITIDRLHKRLGQELSEHNVPIGKEYDWIQIKYPDKIKGHLEDKKTRQMKHKISFKEKARFVTKVESLLINMNKKIIKDADTKQHEHETSRRRHKNSQHIIIDSGNSLCCFSEKGLCRKMAIALVRNEYFETLSLNLILFYSGILMIMFDSWLDDKYTKKTAANLEMIISVFFIFEVLVRIIAMGLCLNKHAYLRDQINCVDFFLVLTIIFSHGLDIYISQCKTEAKDVETMVDSVGLTKVLRALRPLRLAQAPALRNTVESLISSIPDLGWALCLDVLFMYIFSILGMQILQGRDSSCSVVTLTNRVDCIKGGAQWIKPPANFDNIFSSMLTFFEVQSTEDWHVVLFRAIDSSTKVDQGPVTDNKPELAFIFVFFICSTTFFILNFLITILITSYQFQSTKRFRLDDMQPRQKTWIMIQSFLLEANIKAKSLKPQNKIRILFYDIVKSRMFDNFITICVGINTIGLCIEYHNAPIWYQQMLEIANTIFVVIFTVEALFKIIGYGFRQYFTEKQNCFDFFLVVVSLMGMIKSLINLNLTLLRVIRGARILRVFKSLRELGELLNTLQQSGKSFIYVIFVSFIGLFVYALMGLRFYGNIKTGKYGGLDEHTNFSSIYNAVVTLMKAETGEGWNSMMHDTMEENWSACFFWVTFVILKVYILLNVVIALIFDKLQERAYQKAADPDTSILVDAIQDFVQLWQEFDPKATHFIPTQKLEEFLFLLPPPLGYGKKCCHERELCKTCVDSRDCIDCKQGGAECKDCMQSDQFNSIKIKIHGCNRDSLVRKFIRTSNIPDHEGQIYFPEFLWAIMFQVCGASGKSLECHSLMKENFRKILLKYKHLRTHQKCTWARLTGNHQFNWLTEGLTVFQYLSLVRTQKLWKKSLIIRKSQASNLT